MTADPGMIINIFTECTPVPSFEGLWRDPEDGSGTGYGSLDYWLPLAKTMDRAGVDAVFFADVEGFYDVYQGSPAPALRNGVQIPSIDPVMLIPALAVVTEHLGFAVTYSTSYHPPYHCARVFSTLDALTKGRIAWNVVTSFLSSASRNGIGSWLAHDQRYDRATAYLQVVRSLWEDSWADDAVQRDVDRDVFTDPDQVRAIDHESEWFSVRGPHQCAPTPQRTPVIYQAGASGRGLDFAARHAEAVFMTLSEPRRSGPKVQELRDRVTAAGRPADAVKIIQGMPVVLGRTEDEVASKITMMRELHSTDGRLAKWCGWTDVDLAALPPDALVADLEVAGTRSALAAITRVDPGREWRVRDVMATISAAHVPMRGGRFMLSGTPEQVADQLELWQEKAGVDGFNLVPFPPTRGIDDICELLLPELVRRGHRAAVPPPGTLRERYFGPGARYRPAAEVSA